jgi:hypothetical protein
VDSSNKPSIAAKDEDGKPVKTHAAISLEATE